MMFYRSHSTGICDIDGDRGISLFGGIRPGCFTNIVAANGLVLIPKASEGMYTVRLGFMAQPGDERGKRVCNILLQGEPVLEGFDIVKEAGEDE